MNLGSTSALLATWCKIQLRDQAGNGGKVRLRVFWGAESIPSLRIAKFQVQCAVPGDFSLFPTLSAGE